jgi:hypothetical protein
LRLRRNRRALRQANLRMTDAARIRLRAWSGKVEAGFPPARSPRKYCACGLKLRRAKAGPKRSCSIKMRTSGSKARLRALRKVERTSGSRHSRRNRFNLKRLRSSLGRGRCQARSPVKERRHARWTNGPS